MATQLPLGHPGVVVMITAGFASFGLSTDMTLASLAVFVVEDPLHGALFGGNFRQWLLDSAGIAFDQRNAVVVGFALGFGQEFGVPLDLASALLPWRTRLNFGLLTHIHIHASAQKRYSGQDVKSRSSSMS